MTHIPIADIVSVNFKEPSGFSSGFIEFLLVDGTGSTTVSQAEKLPYAVSFTFKEEQFRVLKDYCEWDADKRAWNYDSLGLDRDGARKIDSGLKMTATILSLLFFAPLGIALLWWLKLWTKKTRIILSAFFAVYFLFMVLPEGDKDGAVRAPKASGAEQNQPKRSDRELARMMVSISLGRQVSIDHAEVDGFVSLLRNLSDETGLPTEQVANLTTAAGEVLLKKYGIHPDLSQIMLVSAVLLPSMDEDSSFVDVLSLACSAIVENAKKQQKNLYK